MFSQVMVWLCIILASAASVIPDIVIKAIENMIERNKVNKLSEIDTRKKITEVFDPVTNVCINQIKSNVSV